MNERKCHECSEPLKGRADQKFCNDQCRSMYNNKNSLDNNSLVHSVNRILKKNHTILTMLQAIGKTLASKSDLQKRGYRFDYFTSTGTSRNNKFCYYCYDHGFRELENNKLVLVNLVLEDDSEQPVKRIPILEPPKNHIQPVTKKFRITDHYKLHQQNSKLQSAR